MSFEQIFSWLKGFCAPVVGVGGGGTLHDSTAIINLIKLKIFVLFSLCFSCESTKRAMR